MSQTILVIITLGASFCGAAALVAAVVSLLRERRGSIAEVRLNELAKASAVGDWAEPEEEYQPPSLVADEPERPAEWERWLARFFDLRMLLGQAGAPLTPAQLLALTGALLLAGSTLGGLTQVPLVAMPVAAALAGSLPWLWLLWKRHQRLIKFESQMPDAMDLLARSLRAGHSMADGLRLIGDEMAEPISREFLRCYRQQALGVPLEATLEEMTARVPNLDLRFFVNAVVLQRQTGGDTAEILDKIARLIRQRFQIRAQVRALTGEGRLSGLVLLALPIVLAIYLYFRNPDYLMILFREPLGHKMVLAAIVLQLLGAVVIKKIVDIKI